MVNILTCVCSSLNLSSCISHDGAEEEDEEDVNQTEIDYSSDHEEENLIQVKEVTEKANGIEKHCNIGEDDIIYNGKEGHFPAVEEMEFFTNAKPKYTPLRFVFNSRKNNYVERTKNTLIENVPELNDNENEMKEVESLYRNKITTVKSNQTIKKFKYDIELRDIFGDYVYGNRVKNVSEFKVRDTRKEKEEMEKFWKIVNDQVISETQSKPEIEPNEAQYPQPLEYQVLSLEAEKFLQEKKERRQKRKKKITDCQRCIQANKWNNPDPKTQIVLQNVENALESINWKLGGGASNRAQTFTHLFAEETSTKSQLTLVNNTVSSRKAQNAERKLESSSHGNCSTKSVKSERIAARQSASKKSNASSSAKANGKDRNSMTKAEKKKEKILKELNKRLEKQAKKQAKQNSEFVQH